MNQSVEEIYITLKIVRYLYASCLAQVFAPDNLFIGKDATTWSILAIYREVIDPNFVLCRIRNQNKGLIMHILVLLALVVIMQAFSH